eukprot:3070187-Rhodomonas_salina.2
MCAAGCGELWTWPSASTGHCCHSPRPRPRSGEVKSKWNTGTATTQKPVSAELSDSPLAHAHTSHCLHPAVEDSMQTQTKIRAAFNQVPSSSVRMQSRARRVRPGCVRGVCSICFSLQERAIERERTRALIVSEPSTFPGRVCSSWWYHRKMLSASLVLSLGAGARVALEEWGLACWVCTTGRV